MTQPHGPNRFNKAQLLSHGRTAVVVEEVGGLLHCTSNCVLLNLDSAMSDVHTYQKLYHDSRLAVLVTKPSNDNGTGKINPCGSTHESIMYEDEEYSTHSSYVAMMARRMLGPYPYIVSIPIGPEMSAGIHTSSVTMSVSAHLAMSVVMNNPRLSFVVTVSVIPPRDPMLQHSLDALRALENVVALFVPSTSTKHTTLTVNKHSCTSVCNTMLVRAATAFAAIEAPTRPHVPLKLAGVSPFDPRVREWSTQCRTRQEQRMSARHHAALIAADSACGGGMVSE